MKDRRVIEGRWWVFGPRYAPKYGSLTFDPEKGLSLAVKIAEDPASTASGILAWASGQIFVPDVIIGRDQHNRPITLYDCRGPGAKTSIGLQTITIQPLYALLEVEGADWDVSQFVKVRAEMTLLHNWMNRLAIQETPTGHGRARYTVNRLDPVILCLNDGVKLSIDSTTGFSRSSKILELTETHTISFDVAPGSLKADGLLNYVRSFSRLLTLLTGHPVYLEELHLTSAESPAQTGELLYINTGVGVAEKDEVPQNMHVNFAEISHRIEDIIRRWYDLYARLDSALNLYFATVFSPHFYSNHYFLFLAQAVEVYHRANLSFNSQVQPLTEFRLRRENIFQNVPPDEQIWLKEKLQHANDKTLAQRLDELLSRHKEHASRFIPNLEAFAQTVKVTRNHFTHYSTKPKDIHKVAADGNLARVTYQLRTLLEICILSDLGIEGAPIDRLIKAYSRIGFADC
jgi:hypothetical protein